MTPQQIVGLFVRLFAVWLLVQAVQMIGFGVALEKQSPNEISSFAIAGVFSCIALALWLFPMAVAHKLIPGTHFSNTVSAPVLDIATVACIVLGLWVLAAHALPGISQFLAIAVVMLKNKQSVWNADWWYFSAFIEGIVQLVVALTLMFRARVIASHLLHSRQPSDNADA